MARSARGRTRNISLGPLVQHKPPSPRPGRNHTTTSRKPTHNNTKGSGLNKPPQNPGLDRWHGGQPTQDTTYRVNVRTGGPTLHLSGERAHEGAQVAVCWLRYGRLRLRLRAAGCGCAVGCAQRVNRRLSCEYSSAPPEPGRGAAAHNNQAFCSTPCMANMRTTMIVLLRAWNSHE